METKQIVLDNGALAYGVAHFRGSPAKTVLSNCDDPLRNQCRAALRDISPPKSDLTP